MGCQSGTAHEQHVRGKTYCRYWLPIMIGLGSCLKDTFAVVAHVSNTFSHLAFTNFVNTFYSVPSDSDGNGWCCYWPWNINSNVLASSSFSLSHPWRLLAHDQCLLRFVRRLCRLSVDLLFQQWSYVDWMTFGLPNSAIVSTCSTCQILSIRVSSLGFWDLLNFANEGLYSLTFLSPRLWSPILALLTKDFLPHAVFLH